VWNSSPNIQNEVFEANGDVFNGVELFGNELNIGTETRRGAYARLLLKQTNTF
jgi:hypothetical protein